MTSKPAGPKDAVPGAYSPAMDGGLVTVKATGTGVIQEIKIDPKAIDPDDPELLADMVQAAVNEAIRSAQALMEQRLGGLAGGALGNLGLGM